jgi:fructose-1,6-bisphosphatase I
MQHREAVFYFQGDKKPRASPIPCANNRSLVPISTATFLYGGIFLYPADSPRPKKPVGKRGFLCEASPLAFVCRQAGGASSDGQRDILDIEPQELHQRVPLFIGSVNDVRVVKEIYA